MKLKLSLVINFIPIGLRQLKVLFEDGSMNWRTFRTLYTFVKIMPLNYGRREKRVLKKSMFDIVPRNVVSIISCSICCPSRGDFIKQILRGWIISYLKEITKIS